MIKCEEQDVEPKKEYILNHIWTKILFNISSSNLISLFYIIQEIEEIEKNLSFTIICCDNICQFTNEIYLVRINVWQGNFFFVRVRERETDQNIIYFDL